MKTSCLLIVLVLIFASCHKENEIIKVNADFTLGDTFVKVYQNIAITNLSDSTSVTYNWNFGDGFLSNEKNPVHSYVTSGEYAIKLRIADHAGNSDSTLHLITVGERFVYEIVINSLAKHKLVPNDINWDEDSTGINASPDLFFIIREQNGTELFKSKTIYNVANNQLPLSFNIPDVKISAIADIGIGSTGIYLEDNDGSVSEEIMSNLMSGVSCSNYTYNKTEHVGAFTVGLFSAYTVKYKIK